MPVFARGCARLLLAAGLLGLVAAAWAQSGPYPSRPISLIVPYAAGSSTDSVVRPIAKDMSERLGAQVVVINRPGGNFAIAINALKASAPDGYTLLVATASMLVQNYTLGKNVGYEPLRDFSYIGTIGIHPGVLVARKGLPAGNALAAFDYAREHPKKLNYSSGGVGAASDVMMQYVLATKKIEMTHIPMAGDNQAMLELAAERVDLALTAAQVAMPMISSDKVNALAVTTPARLFYLSSTPTFVEAGLTGLENVHPYGLAGVIAPAGIPPAARGKLSEALTAIVGSTQTAGMLRNQFRMEPLVNSGDAFRQLIEAQITNWTAIAGTMNAAGK